MALEIDHFVVVDQRSQVNKRLIRAEISEVGLAYGKVFIVDLVNAQRMFGLVERQLVHVEKQVELDIEKDSIALAISHCAI
jgi:hypothetical protein